MRRFLTPILVLIYLNLSGQDIRVSGILTDEKTNEPLAYAHVGIMGTSIGTVTNSNGQFSILIPEENVVNNLSFSYLGYASKSISISDISKNTDYQIGLKPQSTFLPDLVVKVKKKSIIEEAIERIPENHDQENMRLSGFWRAQIKNQNRHIQLSETAYDIFRVDKKDAVKILKNRAQRDTAAFEQFRQFNAGITPKGLVKSSFLEDTNILLSKTRKNHTFDLVGASIYNDRPVFIVEFDRKKDSDKNGYKGTIYLDSETLAFVKIKYSFSPSNSEQIDLYGSRLLAKITGLGESYWLSYLSDYNFKLYNGKWYLSHGVVDVAWYLIDNDETFKELVEYRGDLVITNIDKGVVTLPSKDERAGRGILVRQSQMGTGEFWEEYNYLVPDEDFDRVFSEMQKRNEAYRKQKNESNQD